MTTRQRLPATALAPYAAHPETSRGRRFSEPGPRYRSEYQRDRDRIVHSAAFRRLEYKTQVFVNHEGDMFRTRLTHSIEVAQIGRSIARALSLNEDLVEAIALAHDLGHTPFGHAGQDALNACMREYGGFEHNLQSLRVVDELEQKYAEFDGLNLTFETREGILKHCSLKIARELGDVGERFLNGHYPGLEAQIANLADEIAYNNHDVDDGLRAGLISVDALCEVAFFERQYTGIERQFPHLPERRMIHETVRRMINQQVTDLIDTSQERLQSAAPKDVEAVRRHGQGLVEYSDEMQKQNKQIKQFLRKNLYRHYRVQRMSVKAKRMIQELFRVFMEDGGLLPTEATGETSIDEQESQVRARVIADYIAGMTDRYAIKEYHRLFGPEQLT